MKQKIKTFIINVSTNEIRRKHMMSQAHLIGDDINIFPAIVPDTAHTVPHKYNERKARRFTGRPMLKTEIACGLSHMSLWRQLLNDDDADHYLILEDDVTILCPISEILNKIDLNEISLLKLSGQIKRPAKKVRDIDDMHSLYRYAYGPLDAAAYVVDKKGAAKLLAYCETLHTPIDILMDRSYDHQVPIYGVMPYLVETAFCFDEGAPLYTDIGVRDYKYAPDVTIAERLCVKWQRVLGGVKRKLITLRMLISLLFLSVGS